MSVVATSAAALSALKTETVLAAGNVVAVENPYEGKTPDFEFFGLKFKNALVGIGTGVWAFVILILGIILLVNLLKWGAARQKGMHDDIEDGMAGVKRTSISLACVAAFGVIIGAILQLTDHFM